jgi:arylsulfatase A
MGWANDWVTGWHSTDDYVWWEIDVVRAGEYEVTLLYVCAEQDVGSKIRVEVGGQSVEGVLRRAHDPQPIPSPDRVPRGEVYEKVWAPLTLGKVRLGKGRSRLFVKALSKPGKAVMDLKAVRLLRLD